jgi:hypothetical protein
MNNTFMSISRHQIAAAGLLLGLILLIGVPASAQNLLNNGDFGQPLGPANWTVAYVHGGPDDFEIKDRTTIADRHRVNQTNSRGGHLRPSTDKLAHAYFTQTITNLVPGHTYTLTGQMKWEGPFEFGNAAVTYRVYFEAIGGLGTARTEDLPDTGFDQWAQYSLPQTADANGKIEVRLHLDKFSWCIYDKLPFINGYFDEFSLTY